MCLLKQKSRGLRVYLSNLSPDTNSIDIQYMTLQYDEFDIHSIDGWTSFLIVTTAESFIILFVT